VNTGAPNAVASNNTIMPGQRSFSGGSGNHSPTATTAAATATVASRPRQVLPPNHTNRSAINAKPTVSSACTTHTGTP